MTKALLKKHINIIIIFLISFLLFLLFPYTGDDLSWGFNTLSLSLIKHFSQDLSLNGRYMGNIFSVILSQSVIIKSLISSFIITSIIYIIHRCVKVKYIYIILLFLLMPLDIFKESIVWMSGFANYVISTLFLLIFFILFQKNWKERKISYLSFISFIIIILSSLFIENMTVFLLLYLFSANIIYYIKYKRININLVISLIGAIVGFLIMFLHPTYLNILHGNDGYRNIKDDDGLINRIIGNYALVIKKYIVEFSSIIFIFIMYTIKKNHSDNKNKIIDVFFKYSFIYLSYALLLRLTSLESKISYLIYLNIVLSALFIFGFIFITYKLYKQDKNIINVVIAIIGLIAPLFVVTPIGPRNMFMIYVLEIILAMLIYNTSKVKFLESYNQYALYLIVILLFYYINIYSVISYYYNKRSNYINQINICQNELIIYRMPLGEYLHAPDSLDSKNYYLKNKYHISENTIITYIDYADFKKE